MEPQIPVSKLTGIGQYYSYKLKRLEINTLEDLIYHFPFRYDDFSKIGQIREVTPGEKTSIQGVVWQIKNIRTRSGKFVTVATVADQSGTIEVIWFNQPYLTKSIKPGSQISLSGKVELEGHKYKLIAPQYEILRGVGEIGVIGEQSQAIDSPATLHTGRLVPIYPKTEGVSSKWLRAKIAKILPQYLKKQEDFLPREIAERQNLITLRSALSKIHFPKSYDDAVNARERLSFDELFLIQFISAARKKSWKEERVAPQMKIVKEKITDFVKNLPFKLTSAQIRAIKEILVDLSRQIPANRLLEGDVGSGKTVVAAAACFVAFDNGFDALVAAPTEILAFQHQETLQQTLSKYRINVGIWTGSKKIKGNITCGTHALLSTFKASHPVGLVIVDEQHRFGVAQRAKLFLNQSEKLTPHLLTMTATPIPRTLALTLYGDLDLSVLDEMPPGRQKIATFVVPNFKRKDAYKFIEKQIADGRQAFIITPFVEPSETMQTVKAATQEFSKLKNIFSHPTPSHLRGSEDLILDQVENDKGSSLHQLADRTIHLGLLHGRLKSKDKEKVINDFKSNKINILVTTPVVEVGIDVPNATIMMIESAERFGLAQLHQLRGRVGRGKHKSYCLLFTDSNAPNSIKRLKSMEKIYVGFELAEIDLAMRGPGEIFGLKQSGFINLKLADITDQAAVARAQKEAKNLVVKDPDLKKYPLLKQKIENRELDLVQPN